MALRCDGIREIFSAKDDVYFSARPILATAAHEVDTRLLLDVTDNTATNPAIGRWPNPRGSRYNWRLLNR